MIFEFLIETLKLEEFNKLINEFIASDPILCDSEAPINIKEPFPPMEYVKVTFENCSFEYLNAVIETLHILHQSEDDNDFEKILNIQQDKIDIESLL